MAFFVPGKTVKNWRHRSSSEEQAIFSDALISGLGKNFPRRRKIGIGLQFSKPGHVQPPQVGELKDQRDTLLKAFIDASDGIG